MCHHACMRWVGRPAPATNSRGGAHHTHESQVQQPQEPARRHTLVACTPVVGCAAAGQYDPQPANRPTDRPTHHQPTNQPTNLQVTVQDVDGHVLGQQLHELRREWGWGGHGGTRLHVGICNVTCNPMYWKRSITCMLMRCWDSSSMSCGTGHGAGGQEGQARRDKAHGGQVGGHSARVLCNSRTQPPFRSHPP